LPPRPLSPKDLREMEQRFYNRGTADFKTEGLTREDEDIQLKNVFHDIRKLGDYNHIHTIRVVPGDGREPYLIHDIEVDTK
jgi:hypothetical protein